MKISPSERKTIRLMGLDVMAYVAMTSSTEANLTVDSVMTSWRRPR